MPELIVTILIFIAVIAITLLLFGGWLIAMIVSGLGRLAVLPFRARASGSVALEGDASPLRRCTSGRCRAENAPVATYCRRGGCAMRPAQQVPVRRVAMW